MIKKSISFLCATSLLFCSNAVTFATSESVENEQHEHEFVYEYIDEETHDKSCFDSECDFSIVNEFHNFDEFGDCICGAKTTVKPDDTDNHDEENIHIINEIEHNTAYIDQNDGTHLVTCTCMAPNIGEDEVFDCGADIYYEPHNFIKGFCTECGASDPDYMLSDYNFVDKEISYEIDDVLITATGSMPENAELRISNVSLDSVKSIISGYVDNYSTDVKVAYDICIYVGDEEYQPEKYDKNVVINISNLFIDTSDNLTMYHIADSGVVETVDSTDISENDVTFTAESFSVYALAGDCGDALKSWNCGNYSGTFDKITDPSIPGDSSVIAELYYTNGLDYTDGFKLVIHDVGHKGTMAGYLNAAACPWFNYFNTENIMPAQYPHYYITDLYIEDGVTSIGYGDFNYFNALENVYMADSVTTIGGFAFGDCASLEDLSNFSSNITSVDPTAFKLNSPVNNLVDTILADDAPDVLKNYDWVSSFRSLVIPTSYSIALPVSLLLTCEESESSTPDAVTYKASGDYNISVSGSFSPSKIILIQPDSASVDLSNGDTTVVGSLSQDRITYSMSDIESDNAISCSLSVDDVVDAGNYQGSIDYTFTFDNDPNVKTVVFKNYNGAIISSVDYKVGDTVTVPSDPTRPYNSTYTYTFAGWDQEIQTTCVDSITYTATYTPTYRDYKVNYYADDKTTLLYTDTYHYNDTIDKRTCPDKADSDVVTTSTSKYYTHYNYGSWVKFNTSTKANIGDFTETTCKADVNCYPMYSKSTIYTAYYIKFVNDDNSTVLWEGWVDKDGTITPPSETPVSTVNSAYPFTGWNPALPATCTRSRTYKAVYDTNITKYTFLDVDGNVLGTGYYSNGDTITPPSYSLADVDRYESVNSNLRYNRFAGWVITTDISNLGKLFMSDYDCCLPGQTLTGKSYSCQAYVMPAKETEYLISFYEYTGTLHSTAWIPASKSFGDYAPAGADLMTPPAQLIRGEYENFGFSGWAERYGDHAKIDMNTPLRKLSSVPYHLVAAYQSSTVEFDFDNEDYPVYYYHIPSYLPSHINYDH